MPKNSRIGIAVHGVIGAFYFYEPGSSDDPAFGFFDIELSVQQLAERRLRVELYCVADGYQSSRGVGADHPLQITGLSKGHVAFTTAWRFPDVICGHADPMNFSIDLDVATPVIEIDEIALDAVEGWAVRCHPAAR